MYAGQIIEDAPADILYEHPRHPYTVGLLNSTLRLDTRRRDLQPIRGTPPAANGLPSGCRFHPRCDFALEACKTAAVELTSVPQGVVRCIRANELLLEPR
jgi:oligopeptide/dipeptide ABC transporter ATP-binding protein